MRLALARLVQRGAGLQRRADGTLALAVLDRGGDAHEVIALAREHGGNAAGLDGKFVHRTVVFVDQGAVAAQLARGLVELHGGLEIALEALHGELHQLAVGGVGRVQREAGGSAWGEIDNLGFY